LRFLATLFLSQQEKFMQTINIQMDNPADVEDYIRERAEQIAAVGDLLTRAGEIPTETASNARWLVRSLAEQIGERLEVQD
jgi:hypothetical protein